MAVIARGLNLSWPTLLGRSSLMIRPRPVVLFDARKPTKFMKENCTRKVLPESFKDVSPKKRDGSSWPKYTLVLAAITPQLGPL
jgi:hypothetical protein